MLNNLYHHQVYRLNRSPPYNSNLCNTPNTPSIGIRLLTLRHKKGQPPTSLPSRAATKKTQRSPSNPPIRPTGIQPPLKKNKWPSLNWIKPRRNVSGILWRTSFSDHWWNPMAPETGRSFLNIFKTAAANNAEKDGIIICGTGLTRRNGHWMKNGSCLFVWRPLATGGRWSLNTYLGGLTTR